MSYPWKDSTLASWKEQISAAKPDVVFETGGTRNTFRVYAHVNNTQIGEFVVTESGANDSDTFGSGWFRVT